uniref:Peptidase M14 domain-containing protein n=1 Tax=Meloidogyne enterolobii TaxID=390850 RepID=A0A6V7Y1I0_MELEN|nr:unnamed protein product [Meloidogyne enterolobii]
MEYDKESEEMIEILKKNHLNLKISRDPEIRFWRKNRLPTQCTQINTGFFTPPNTQCCQGVDLNRNFDWFFGQDDFS